MGELRTGVLPRQMLRNLMDTGYITGVDERFLNPASIDLPLSDEAYRIPCAFQLSEGEHVRTVLHSLQPQRHSLSDPLEVGQTYLIRIDGKWKLPGSVYGHANPKSSAGRVNLFARIMADNVNSYDTLFRGWKNDEMWLLVRPDSFRILLHPGIAVSQLRLFDAPSFLDDLQMEVVADKTGLIYTKDKLLQVFYKQMRTSRAGVILTLAVGDDFGFEGCTTNEVIDFGKKGAFARDDNPFFRRIEPENGGFRLNKAGFYILSTNELVKVPTNLSAELRPIDPRLGEFRSHAAGYIDPGWGCGKDGKGRARPITLEVIPFEKMFVRHGQAIARMRYEHMKEKPDVPYDEAESHYTGQGGPTLSKHFV